MPCPQNQTTELIELRKLVAASQAQTVAIPAKPATTNKQVQVTRQTRAEIAERDARLAVEKQLEDLVQSTNSDRVRAAFGPVIVAPSRLCDKCC